MKQNYALSPIVAETNKRTHQKSNTSSAASAGKQPEENDSVYFFAGDSSGINNLYLVHFERINLCKPISEQGIIL
jgi:hypothetical protein